MKYYKTISDGVITMIGSGSRVHESQAEITKEEYDSLIETIKSKPEDTLESVYYLSAETEMYEPRERTETEKVQWYQNRVDSGEITLEEVPTEYQSQIEVPLSEDEAWATELMNEVSEVSY